MKINLVSALVLTSLGMSTMGGLVQAAEYPSETEGRSDVTASVILGDDGGPTIPPVEPVEPPVDPGPVNPNTGPLALRYVSDLVFGEVEVSTEALTIYANRDSDLSGVEFDNMVTVQDFRGDSERDGWELTVEMDSAFIPGSELKMSPHVNETAAQELGLEIPTSGLILNEAAQVFARTTSNANPAGIVSIGQANSESNGVELSIPANTPEGEYSTTLTWNLSNGPVLPE